MLLENPLNQSSPAFPILECCHIAGFICGVGTAALVDLRLLGVGLTQKSPSQLWRDTTPWTLGGLTLAIFSGLLLFSINPDTYYLNHAFLLKMLFLVLAIVCHYILVRKAAAIGTGETKNRIVACVSLCLWGLVVFGGIFIGFNNAISATVFPVILSLHMAALAFFGGMIVVTDLRLLGLGMRTYSVSDIVNGLRVPKRVAFVLASICGLLLLRSGAGQYLHDRWFWIKIGLLALIGASYMVFRRGAYENSAQNGKAKLTAALSLLLWTGVVCAARGPATIKDIMHSMVDPSGDFLFKSVQEIADERGVREQAPQTDADWDEVRQRLIVLEDVPDVLTAEGRRAARPEDRSKNPEVESEPWEVQSLVDTDRTNFIRRARRLHDAAAVAMKAVDAKDPKALNQALDGIDRACENCHLHYWYPNDKRAQEAAKENGNTD